MPVLSDARLHRDDALHALSNLAAASLGRLLIIAGALDIARQAFLLAQLLEAANHLLDRLVAARFNPDHARLTLGFRLIYRRTLRRAET